MPLVGRFTSGRLANCTPRCGPAARVAHTSRQSAHADNGQPARRGGSSPSPDWPPTLPPTYDDLDPKGQDHHDERQAFVRFHRTSSSWTPAGLFLPAFFRLTPQALTTGQLGAADSSSGFLAARAKGTRRYKSMDTRPEGGSQPVSGQASTLPPAYDDLDPQGQDHQDHW